MKLTATTLFASTVLTISLIGCASTDYANNPDAHDKLHAQAKLDREAAEKIALTRVPGGAVREAELEKEKSRVIWSFEITSPGSAEVTEVEVDANTGEIISVEKEDDKEDDEDKD